MAASRNVEQTNDVKKFFADNADFLLTAGQQVDADINRALARWEVFSLWSAVDKIAILNKSALEEGALRYSIYLKLRERLVKRYSMSQEPGPSRNIIKKSLQQDAGIFGYNARCPISNDSFDSSISPLTIQFQTQQGYNFNAYALDQWVNQNPKKPIPYIGQLDDADKEELKKILKRKRLLVPLTAPGVRATAGILAVLGFIGFSLLLTVWPVAIVSAVVLSLYFTGLAIAAGLARHAFKNYENSILARTKTTMGEQKSDAANQQLIVPTFTPTLQASAAQSSVSLDAKESKASSPTITENDFIDRKVAVARRIFLYSKERICIKQYADAICVDEITVGEDTKKALKEKIYLQLRQQLIHDFATINNNPVPYAPEHYAAIRFNLSVGSGPLGYNHGICPITKCNIFEKGVRSADQFETEQGFYFNTYALDYWIKNRGNQGIPAIGALSPSDLARLSHNVQQASGNIHQLYGSFFAGLTSGSVMVPGLVLLFGAAVWPLGLFLLAAVVGTLIGGLIGYAIGRYKDNKYSQSIIAAINSNHSPKGQGSVGLEPEPVKGAQSSNSLINKHASPSIVPLVPVQSVASNNEPVRPTPAIVPGSTQTSSNLYSTPAPASESETVSLLNIPQLGGV